MNHHSLRRADFGPLPLPPHPTLDRRELPGISQTLEERQYREMELAFRFSGGMVSSDELTRRLRRHTDQPVSRLARWIVSREVLSLDWQARAMLPQFQFDLATMTLRPEATQVLRELTPVLSDWDLALWLARPNGWLADAAPVDALATSPRAVLDAARAERFLARG